MSCGVRGHEESAIPGIHHMQKPFICDCQRERMAKLEALMRRHVGWRCQEGLCDHWDGEGCTFLAVLEETK